MTPERMRVKLAEWAGWGKLRTRLDMCVVGVRGGHSVHTETPDYPNNLNAVRELVIKLAHSDQQKYGIYLDVLDGLAVDCDERPWLVGHDASAKQRCEALCKSLGLWEDEK